MKLVDVCAFYTPSGGGVRTYVDRKLAFAEARRLDLTVIVPGATDRIERRGRHARLRHLATPALPLDRRYRYFDSVAAVHDALDREAPDWIEASSPWRTASIVAGWPGPARRSLVMHADPLAAYPYRWFGGIASRATIDRRFGWYWNHLRRAAARFDLVVSANAGLSERLRRGGIGPVRTLPLGVESGLFSPHRRDEGLRAALLADLGLAPDAHLLIGVGRLAAEKRWAAMIDAVRIAGMHRPLGLLLVGAGKERQRLGRAIAGNPHIRLAPPVERAALATMLASADLLVHGCEAETFGLVAAEAVASGLPLVVPDEGGAAALATSDRAETFRAGDARAAAAAIGRLLAREPMALRRATLAAAAAAPTIADHFEALLAAYASFAPVAEAGAPLRRSA